MLVKFRQGLYGNLTHRQPRFGVEFIRVPKCSVFAPAHSAQPLIKSEQGVIPRQPTADAVQFVVKAQGKLIQRRIAAKLSQVRQADTIVVLTIPLLGEALAWIRFARFFRLARFAVIVSRALQAERRLTSGDSLRIASILTVTAIIVAGAAQSATSHDFDTLWDGVWWAIETVSTVGYGDIYPSTVQGRLIALVLMFVGIGFLSLLTAAIASRFVKQERGDEHDEVMETLRQIQADVAELKSQMR